MGISIAKVRMPMAVVGIAGIYDIPYFVDDPSHPDRHDPYRQIIVGAFGDDEELWKRASPALREDLLVTGTSWDTKKAWLFHSDADELVEPHQSRRMFDLLEKCNLHVEFNALSRAGEKHDDTWQKGYSLVDAIQQVVSGYR